MSARSFNVTLPAELVDLVRDKIASGAYASESEVVSAGLRALQAHDAVLEEWLRTEGVARYDAYSRDGAEGRPAAEVFARLRAHHAESAK